MVLRTYRRRWIEMKRLAEAEYEGMNPEDEEAKRIYAVIKKINFYLNLGSTQNQRNEAINLIRLKTLIDPELLNVGRYIPFKNGYLNLKTMNLEEPKGYFTYMLNARYIEGIQSLDQMPMYKRFLETTFQSEFIPLINDYMGYTFLSKEFPAQIVLFFVGLERMGKGALLRLRGLISDKDMSTLRFDKLMMPDNRFVFQKVMGVNLLFDPETKRDYNYKMDFHNFNTLFGGDTIEEERKFKEPKSKPNPKAKGIFLANLPLFRVENEAFLARIRIAVTNTERHSIIPDIEKKIFEAEGDMIASFWANRLHALMEKDFEFPQTEERARDLWERLTSSVDAWLSEVLMDDYQGIDPGELRDIAYNSYISWCNEHGIVPLKPKAFSNVMGKMYHMKRRRLAGELTPYFEGLHIDH